MTGVTQQAIASAMEEGHRSFGPFVLDGATGVLRRDGEVVPLGRRAFDLLAALAEADGAAVTKDALMARAWPGLFVEEANLSVQIAGLRKTLGKAADGQEWIATVPRVGYRLPRPSQIAGPTLSSTRRPMVAVMPFTTMPDDTEQAYFADGLVEDLITALSRFRTFAVVSRNASFGFRERGLDGAAITEHGVRYLVEGMVRRRATQLRVSVRLVDATSATQLWAQQFDGSGAELFDFFDEVVVAVVGFVEPEVRRAEIERARRKHPGSLDAYDLYLKALPLFRGTSAEVRAEAIALLEGAVRLDPGFATGLVYAAWAYERQDTFGSGMSQAERERALQLAEQALEIGHDDPQVVAIAALILLSVRHDSRRALAMLDQAYAANPNNPTVMSLTAFTNVMAGDIDFGHRCFLRAIEIAPGALDNYELLVGVGIAHLLKGEFEAAADWALKSLAANAEWVGAMWTLAAAQAHLDRMDEARATVATILSKVPGMRMADLERVGLRFGSRFRLQIEGLRKAGLPD